MASFVYIFQCDDSSPLKIGFSRDVPNRLWQMQNYHCDTVRSVFCGIGTRVDERRIHRKLAKYRVRGEWFNCDVDRAIDAAIKCGVSQVPLDDCREQSVKSVGLLINIPNDARIIMENAAKTQGMRIGQWLRNVAVAAADKIIRDRIKIA